MRSSSRTTTPSVTANDRVGRRAAALGGAVGVFGISFGVLAVAAGLPPWLTVLCSVLVLAGGAQFAFIAVIGAGGAPLAAAVSGLLLNLRFIPFGLALAPRLPSAPLWRRLVDSYLLVDESVALGLAGARKGTARRFRIAGWTVVATWLTGTALGAYGGQLLDPERFGLDAAFPAGFLALLAPWLKTGAGRVAAVTGALLALVLTPVAPPGVPIVAAGLGALVGLRSSDRRGTGSTPAGDHRDGA